MTKLQQLLNVLSEPSYEASYAIAKANGKCIMCGNGANGFRDASSKLEYSISALCQKCQDEYLGGK
ncbi:hypothetical protein ACFL9T_01065 [Thermodesulfobacteriota bacterium]